MKTLRKIPPAQLSLMALLILILGLAVTLKLTVKAQDISVNASPPAWQDADIGTVAVAGNVQADGSGGYQVSASGADIWGNMDAFHYVYQSLNGDGEIVVRVANMQSLREDAKAGVMLRETLGADSRNAFMLTTIRKWMFFQWRPVAGEGTMMMMGNMNQAMPCWLKLVRHGDQVGGFGSTDGVNWTLVDWETIQGLPGQVYVGLAFTSHTNEVSGTAYFDQATISPVPLADMPSVLQPQIGTGDGLLGNYYPNRHLYGTPATNRVDQQIGLNFWADVWNQASGTVEQRCQKVIGHVRLDEFSVRWTGELQAQFTEPYTLYVNAKDGVRVWLNEQLIMDDWNDYATNDASRELQATVNLTAGQRYLIRIEYWQNHGQANIQFSWSSPSTPGAFPRRPVPQSQLYSHPTDTDGNGLPDLWEQHYFGQIGVDPNADPDGDGRSNLQEYQQGTDPTRLDLPPGWGHGDLETAPVAGSTVYSNGVFQVSSMGWDLWGWVNQGHFAYRMMGTNEEMVARVLAVNEPDPEARVGMMLQERLDSDARMTMLVLHSTNGVSYSCRPWAHGNSTEAANQQTFTLPYWIKMVRGTDWVGGYVSQDGINWTLVNWETLIGLAPRVYVGLAVSGHGSFATGQFDQVSVEAADPAEILHPLVGTGDGLIRSYRNDSLLYLPGITNFLDPWAKSFWPHETPADYLNPDSYGVLWSGEVQAQFSEPYTFSLTTLQEDWVRVWVNDHLVVDGWRKYHSGGDLVGSPINLVAGQHYLIRVEMFNNGGKGQAQLDWSSPSTPKHTVPQSQLYSQPTDTDGNGLPDSWEMLYFGHLGVAPNADPDGDGLSNLQEYRYHTNPTKADTDGDGMPDAWEIAHGLDPQYAGDGGLDYDNSGFSNLQDYLYGLDPFNSDSNGDGLPDAFELGYLGANSTFSITNTVTVAAVANGSQATNYLGNWQVDGNDIYCLDRRGGLDFNVSVANADKYVFNIIGTQNQPNIFETKFKLLLGIDGQTLGHYTLIGGWGTNGAVELVLPYLQAGTHTVHVFWDGVASYSSLRIKQVKLLNVSGSINQSGIKKWAAKMISDQSGLDNTNTVISSYTSPVCLEGRDPYPALTQITNNLTNTLSAMATSDNRWYVNAPLQAGTQTVFQASYQNGALTQTRSLQWLQVNLLTATNNPTIRAGDSLLFNAIPTNGINGNLQVVIGTNTYTGKTTKPASYRFTTPGLYTVTGTYTPTSGSPKSGSVTVDVVQQNLPNVEPAAWTGMQRNLNLPSLAPEAVLQADSRLTCTLAGTNVNGGTQLVLGTDANEERSILARLGTNGPVLDSTRVSGFDVWSGNQTYTKILQVYPDGSQLVEMLIISSPVETNVTFVIQPIVSGVMFDDGTTLKTLTSTNFDALGRCPVRFIRPASATTSVCNSIKAYQGNYQIGYGH